jgi:ArsR family transcriptional regulator
MDVDALSMLDTFTTVNGRHKVISRSGAVAPTARKTEGAEATDDAESQCCPSVLACALDVQAAGELAHGFTALADPVRLQVLSILAATPAGEVCVCEFVEPLGKSQPTVSHHMKILSEAGLVSGQRRGKWVYYSLNRGRLASLRASIDT